MPIAEISSVGGMACRRPSAARYSLLSESFPEMKGVLIKQARFVAAAGRFQQAAQGFGSQRVAPAEVIQQRNSLRVGSHRHRVADGLIDHADRHAVGIELADIPG